MWMICTHPHLLYNLDLFLDLKPHLLHNLDLLLDLNPHLLHNLDLFLNQHLKCVMALNSWESVRDAVRVQTVRGPSSTVPA